MKQGHVKNTSAHKPTHTHVWVQLVLNDCVHASVCICVLQTDSEVRCVPLSLKTLGTPSSHSQFPFSPNTHAPLICFLFSFYLAHITHTHTPMLLCSLPRVASPAPLNLGLLCNSRHGQGMLLHHGPMQVSLSICTSWLSHKAGLHSLDLQSGSTCIHAWIKRFVLQQNVWTCNIRKIKGHMKDFFWWGHTFEKNVNIFHTDVLLHSDITIPKKSNHYS